MAVHDAAALKLWTTDDQLAGDVLTRLSSLLFLLVHTGILHCRLVAVSDCGRFRHTHGVRYAIPVTTTTHWRQNAFTSTTTLPRAAPTDVVRSVRHRKLRDTSSNKRHTALMQRPGAQRRRRGRRSRHALHAAASNDSMAITLIEKLKLAASNRADLICRLPAKQRLCLKREDRPELGQFKAFKLISC